MVVDGLVAQEKQVFSSHSNNITIAEMYLI